MNRADLQLVVGLALAVAAPAILLHYSAADERLTAGLTTAPFGWPRLLVAHLVTALPLGLIVAGWVRALPAVKDTPRGLWVALGFGCIGLVAVLAPGIGESIVLSEFGFIPLLLLRSFLAFALVFPWCVAAIDPPTKARPAHHPGVAFGLGLGLAIIPCGLYAEAMAAARTEQAAEFLDRERLVRAQGVILGLCELGSEQPINEKPPAELRKAMTILIPKLRQAAERPLPALPTPAARLNRAVLLIQLDRSDDAAALLQPLAPDNTTATLLLATVYRDQEKWGDSDLLYSHALERLLPIAKTDAAARSGCITAFEGMAFNARAERRPADTERVLKRGLESLSAEAAYFHFHLGRHYADGGRPATALEHLRTAVALDPVKFGPLAENQIRHIRTHTPGCLLREFHPPK